MVDVVGMQAGNPEVTWNIDPVASARLGLTVEDVSNQLAASWLGTWPPSFVFRIGMVPVRVRLPDAYRLRTARLPDTLIRTPDGALVPVAALARTCAH